MNPENIMYMCAAIFSLPFGYLYRTIRNKNLKKNMGTCIGVAIMSVYSGRHFLHLLITVLINMIIILKINKKRCHLASFIFSFLYLTFLRSAIYFGIPFPPPLTRLCHMVLILKLVGLAFEVHSSESNPARNEQEKDQHELTMVEVNWIDIVHYSFNYVTFTVPYCKYRTFIDYFDYPFPQHVQWKREVFSRLKYVPLYGIIILVVESIWPLSYMTTDEFYQRSWLYRQWYAWPSFLNFQMKMFMRFLLCSIIGVISGFGAYPSFTNPKPGLGPSEKFSEMKKLLSNKTELSRVEYSFETISSVNVYQVEFGTMRDLVKNWNCCVQYWLVSNIYQRFPYKKYRMVATFLVSVAWHGTHLAYYMSVGLVPIFLIIEDIYIKLYLRNAKGRVLKIYELIDWFYKFYFSSYLSVAFELLSVDVVLKYYNSVYHIGVVLGIILYVVGLFLLKSRTKDEKKPNDIKH